MGQSLAIPRVIPNDWKRLDLIVNKIKMRLGSAGSPTFVGLTVTGLTASTLIGADADKALESVTVGTGLDYTRPTLSLSHLGLEALTDPGADRIFFWDDSASASKWLSVGPSVAITVTNLDTIQDIQTSASPTFANLSLGTGELTAGSINRAAGTLTLEIAGTAEISISSTTITLGGNLVIPDAGYIGSTSDANAVQIAANGEVIFSDIIQAPDFAKTGWPVTSGVTLSFVGGTTRTFTVTDGGSAYYYIDGVKYTLGENKTVVIDDLEGLWFIYFDGATLTASQTIWSFLDEDKAIVAYLYWARDVGTPANGKAIFIGWELHTFHMSGATHARLHYAGGARWETGLLVADAGSEDVNVSAGDIWDEDLNIPITDGAGSALFEQVLSPAQLPIYYREGASAWRIYETNEKAALTDVGYLTGGDLKYNDPTTTWSNETVGLNNYVAYYVVATNEQTEPVVLIMGQRVDNKLSEAQANNVFAGLSLAGLPFEEMVVLARLILKDTGTYTLEEVLDLRAYNIKGNITSPLITQHAGLGGLNWSSAGHYFDAAVDFNAQNISNIGTVGCGIITQSGVTLAATYQPLHANLTSLATLTYAAASFVKMTGADTFALRTIANVRTDLSITNVEDTQLSTWAGTGNITTVGALASGSIAVGFTEIAVDYTAAKCTDATADNTAGNQTSHADVVVDGDIGVSVQAFGAALDDLSALTPPASDGQFIVATGIGAFQYESGATARTSIGLGSVENTALSTWAGTTNITTLGTIGDTLRIEKAVSGGIFYALRFQNTGSAGGGYQCRIDVVGVTAENVGLNFGVTTATTTYYGGVSGGFIDTYSQPLFFGTAGVIRQYISSTGNVHIGGTDPHTKLTIEGALTLKEQAAADADTAAYGQIWVDNSAPCRLRFTNDVGGDFYAVVSDAGTGGADSAGAGKQYVEMEIAGSVYKVLHDGTV